MAWAPNFIIKISLFFHAFIIKKYQTREFIKTYIFNIYICIYLDRAMLRKNEILFKLLFFYLQINFLPYIHKLLLRYLEKASFFYWREQLEGKNDCFLKRISGMLLTWNEDICAIKKVFLIITSPNCFWYVINKNNNHEIPC